MSDSFIIIVTGAAGNIGSSLIFQLINQNIFGKDKKLILRLIEIPEVQLKLEGLKLELEDCIFDKIFKVEIRQPIKESFEDADCVIFLSGKPRMIGMDRKDLLEINASLFKNFGLICNVTSKPTTKYLIVANPCNTNAMVFSQFAPKIPTENITALSSLDYMRATLGVSEHLNVNPTRIKDVIVYGNHSTSLFVDVSLSKLKNEETDSWEPVGHQFDLEFAEKQIQNFVHQRPNEILIKKGTSSSFSASQAIINHLKWWYLGCPDQLVSMAVFIDKMQNQEINTWVSMPVICQNGSYQVVNLELIGKSESQIRKIMVSIQSLLEEKECAKLYFETDESISSQ